MRLFVLVFLLVMLGACGGGGGGATGNVTAATSVVSGVAATGAQLVGTVYLKDSSTPATELSTTIAADGSFSFDVTGLTKPFLLKAVGTSNGRSYTLYSIAGVPGTANINPLSHMAVITAGTGVDIASLYANLSPTMLQSLHGGFTDALAAVLAKLQPLLSASGQTNVDPVGGTFAADHKGLDGLFDLLTFTITDTQITIANKADSTVIYAAQTGNILGGSVNIGGIPSGSSGNGAISSAPSISGFTPASGTVGSLVTIIGTNLSQSAQNPIVKFNGMTAVIISSSATQIVATVPAGATSGLITVTSGNQTATCIDSFTVTANGTAAALLTKVSDLVIKDAYVTAISYNESAKNLVAADKDGKLYVFDLSDPNNPVLKNSIATGTAFIDYLIPDGNGVSYSEYVGGNNHLDLTTLALSRKNMTYSAQMGNGDGGVVLGVSSATLPLSTGRSIKMVTIGASNYLKLLLGQSEIDSLYDDDWWNGKKFKGFDLGNGAALIFYAYAETFYKYDTTTDKLALAGRYRLSEGIWDLNLNTVFKYQDYLFVVGNGYLFNNDAKLMVYRLN